MQVYTDKKEYLKSCKCWDCRKWRRSRFGKGAVDRSLKKRARRAGKREITAQLFSMYTQ